MHAKKKRRRRKESNELKMMLKIFVWMTGCGSTIDHNGEDHGVNRFCIVKFLPCIH